MYSLKIAIAGHVIEIRTSSKLSKKSFLGFLTQTQAELQVDIPDDMIVNKQLCYNHSDSSLIGWIGNIDDSKMLQMIADCLIRLDDIVLFHGASIAYKNNAFIFMAPSGTGKTTHVNLWLAHLSDVNVVNGDKPFVIFPNDGSFPLVCGSPWAGKEGMCSNSTVPLKSIILIERAENNHIEQISFSAAFPNLLQQVYRPDDEEKMRKTLRLMQRLSSMVTFWRFQCNNFKDDCFDIVYNALVRDR